MKKPSLLNSDFMEGFSEWAGSPAGLESMEALDYVFAALDGAKVDLSKKKIIWSDEQCLSIDQCMERIHKSSGLDRNLILSHIIGWLQMEYEPEGLDENQLEQFENQIDNWVEEYETKLTH
jgi:hypothetical protein